MVDFLEVSKPVSIWKLLTWYSGAVTAWTGLIKVDGTLYTWMGAPLPDAGVALVTQGAFSYTATKSIFSLSAGPVNLKVTFTSPVYPDDQMRQSLLFSYMEIAVESGDGAGHDVQLYADISAGKVLCLVCMMLAYRTRMDFWRPYSNCPVGLCDDRCRKCLSSSLPPDSTTIL